MIILQYHEVFFRLAAPTAMPAHLGAYSLEKTSWYRNIIILFGVEEHPKYCTFIPFSASIAFLNYRVFFSAWFWPENLNYHCLCNFFNRFIYNFFKGKLEIWTVILKEFENWNETWRTNKKCDAFWCLCGHRYWQRCSLAPIPISQE